MREIDQPEFYKGTYKGFKITHKDKPQQWSLVNVKVG